MTGRHPDSEDAPLAGLFAEVITGVSRLVRGEIALAKAEMQVTLRQTARAAAQIALAGILALVGLNVLAGAAVAALVAAGLAPVWSALVVGLAFVLLALGYLQHGAGLWRKTDFLPRRLRGEAVGPPGTFDREMTQDGRQESQGNV